MDKYEKRLNEDEIVTQFTVDYNIDFFTFLIIRLVKKHRKIGGDKIQELKDQLKKLKDDKYKLEKSFQKKNKLLRKEDRDKIANR
jgi:hypothetical protein